MIKRLIAVSFVAMASLVLSQSNTTDVSAVPKKSSESSYHYTAQEGDSYSQIARKAVQTYGIKTNTKLSPAQILFAENGLTTEAGSVELNLGQTVDVTESSVRSWIDKAKKLTADEKAAWTYYVPFVEFNTNNVGE